MTTNTITSPTPIYDEVSAAMGFNPVPGQPEPRRRDVPARSRPVAVKARPEPTVVREAVQPTVVQG